MRTDSSPGILRIGLYIRYSTDEQRLKSYSAEMQWDECVAKLGREYPGVHSSIRKFEDLGLTGAMGVYDPASPQKQYRRGLTDLLNAIADRELDLIMAYSQDRLARDELIWHSMNSAFFQRYRIPVLFARENHNILTDEGQLASSFHALVASIERRKISHNVSAACRRRAVEGYVSLPSYGWMWDPEQVKAPRQRRRIVRDEVQGAVLLEIRERYAAGWPTVEIVRDLHRRGIVSPRGGLRWTTDGLLKVLRNRVHAGLVRNKGEFHDGQHSQLRYWTPEEHELLEQRISERAARPVHGPIVERFLLSGALFCAHCGRRLVGSTTEHGGRRQYSCTSPRTEGELRSCPGLARLAEDLESAIVDAVAKLARSSAVQTVAQSKLEEALDAADVRLTRELTAIEKELSQVEQGFSRLFDMLDKQRITEDEFGLENQRRREQRESLLARQGELHSQLAQRRTRKFELERSVTLLRDFDRLWGCMTNGERRQLLLQIDPHMTVRRVDDDLVLTISPAFADPIELLFVGHHRPPKQGPQALTPRQLAILCHWQDGLDLHEIAQRLEIASGTVRWALVEARQRLGVETTEQAVAAAADRMAECRPTLRMGGRQKPRSVANPALLTDALVPVLRLLAEGKGCVAIAKALGKNKSTVSRQLAALYSRLNVRTQNEAVARAQELGLLA